MESIRKYPRTHHIEGSRLQPGDEDLSAVRRAELRGTYLVIEEKLDGANAGLGFGPGRQLRLQSRGHYLVGGRREKHFDLFKQWAHGHAHDLWDIAGDRYVVYGEWLYAKHTIFYDALPHYFLEFDMFDTREQVFLSTDRRHEILAGSPVVSVPVLWRGEADSLADMHGLIGRSLYKTDGWRERLAATLTERGLDPERLRGETDPADEMEGLYLKVEAGDHTVDRYKFIRASFLTSVVDSGSHWLDRPIVPNQLAEGAGFFA